MKLSCHDQSEQVQSMMKSSKDNNMIEHIGLIYIEIELLGIIDRVRSMMKIWKSNDVIDRASVLYIDKNTKLSWSNKLDAIYYKY